MADLLYDAPTRARLLQARVLLGLVGVALGLFLVLVFWSPTVPFLLPLLVLLALPEIATGYWLWRKDARPGRGFALFLGYLAWGILRWLVLTAVGLYGLFLVAHVVLQSQTNIRLSELTFAGEQAQWLFAGVGVSLLVALLAGVVLQVLALLVARCAGAKPYIKPAVVYAYLRDAYPPPLAVTFVNQAAPLPVVASVLSGILGVVACFFSVIALLTVVMSAEQSFFARYSTLGAVCSFLTIPVGIGLGSVVAFVAHGQLSRWFRPPTPRDCWEELYPAPVTDLPVLSEAPASTSAQAATSGVHRQA